MSDKDDVPDLTVFPCYRNAADSSKDIPVVSNCLGEPDMNTLTIQPSYPTVDAGPAPSAMDPLPWRVEGSVPGVRSGYVVDAAGKPVFLDSHAHFIAHRVSHWDALRAQLAAALARIAELEAP